MNGKHALRNGILWGLGFALMIAALYMVFIYVPTEKHTGIIQRIFYFHVPVAWVSFLAFFITFISSILYLWKRQTKWDAIACASVEVGVIFTTLVLITGPIWAKPVWGIWWTWDARLTTSLVLWLIYIAYLLVRSLATEPAKGARYSAVIGIVGFIDVPIVFLTVNMWRTQHPTTIIFEGGLTTPMLMTLLVCIAAFTVLYVLLVIQSSGLKTMEAEIRRLRIIKAE
ncbi:MAG: cytochrome c biogenesis protein CcsA [Dehalococcoidales bacterium]|nr:cytochrome c biogenesis protein CcsA [Dehalococcoidales bacterium]